MSWVMQKEEDIFQDEILLVWQQYKFCVARGSGAVFCVPFKIYPQKKKKNV